MNEILLIMCTTAFNYCDNSHTVIDTEMCVETASELCNNAEAILQKEYTPIAKK